MSNQPIQLSNYSFENHQIRTTIKNDEIWFVAKDVCDAVKISNVADALIKLDNDEKATVGLTDSRNGSGAQRISIISESGMYTLILRCRDAVKKGTAPYKFKKWVTSEVLPSIRKTGSYSLTLNKQQQYLIKEAVLNTAAKTGKTYQSVYRSLYTKFKVPRYQDILAKDFDEAIQLLTVTSKENQSYIMEIPFDLRRNSRYLVQILNGKAQRVSIAYAEMQEDYGKPWSPK
jgi:Prophage antirepressor